nr:L-seryl-tRNA(Sec) selenium transferase [Bacilli bacterium]
MHLDHAKLTVRDGGVSKTRKQDRLRTLPAMHRLLNHPRAQKWHLQFGKNDVLAVLTSTLDGIRQENNDEEVDDWIDRIFQEAELAFERLALQRLQMVINATGTVLHTNLGRAPLAKEAVDAVIDVAKGYSNVEYNLLQGQRGHRHDAVEALLCRLTGAEAALVVNNNAAAVLLALSELASDRDVVISRGELIEIGGSFRIPDVMKMSGARLLEVGTTNKTHERDYRDALEQGASVMLRVHTSNFRIEGFTQKPTLTQLVALARTYDVPLLEDLGSGSLLDLQPYGIGDEPTIAQSLQAGVDVVMFSGDKLLGGAQAGILCGKKVYLDRMKQNPLMRALRVDKMTLAALRATLSLYLEPKQAFARIPALALLTASPEHLLVRADSYKNQLQEKLQRQIAQGTMTVRVVPCVSVVGGGTMPTVEIPSYALAISFRSFGCEALLECLRRQPLPIIARMEQKEVICDVRTVFTWQEEAFIDGIARACLGLAGESTPDDVD